jgi:hypothetical protein
MKSVFLSHSSKDKQFVRRLGNDLRRYGVKVWIDEVEMNGGNSSVDKISEGLENMDYFIVVLSVNSIKSEWVKKEINAAINKEVKSKKDIIIPCLLDDCEIPILLHDKTNIDFKNMPRYVDARKKLIRALGLKEKKAKELFLDQHIFYDLTDLNDGFDVEAIRYFSKKDFIKVLQRAEYFKIKIYGIEPWPNGEFAGVRICEEYRLDSDNSEWYWKAFNDFIADGITSYFSASYDVPSELLKIFK